eukprot:scaffold274223_cov19-Tisochrysis_lutea.AAC.2
MSSPSCHCLLLPIPGSCSPHHLHAHHTQHAQTTLPPPSLCTGPAFSDLVSTQLIQDGLGGLNGGLDLEVLGLSKRRRRQQIVGKRNCWLGHLLPTAVTTSSCIHQRSLK